jgi:bile acid-coenzyme A ligase
VPGPLPIGEIFRHFATTRPDVIALRQAVSGDTLTWAQLHRRTNRLARDYAQRGVRRDDLVGVAVPNGIEFYEVCVAAWKLGATPMPLSPKLPDAERDRVLRLGRPTLIAGAADPSGEITSVPVGHTPAADLPDTDLPECSPTYWKVLSSGGSTGAPKLIVARDTPRFDPETPAVGYIPANGVHLVAGPLYHNAAFIYSMRGLFCGNQLVIMPRFDAARALESLAAHRVTWTQVVPTMMGRIWRLPPEQREAADLSALRTVLHVGGPCAPWLKRAWIDWLGPERIVEVYAGTEGQGMTVIDGAEWLAHPGSVGRAARGSQVRILDELGEPVPAGTVGEVYLMPVGGPGTTYHYLGATPRSVEGGWESLGDLGYLDEDGFLYLVDRSTDCIVSGGANVYPAEVEGALEAHPAVDAVAVIGLPDEDLGQRVVAIVQVDPSAGTPDPAVLTEHLETLIAPYKRPRAYEFVTEPIRDEAGKVRRSALRKARMPAARSGAGS